MNMVSRHQATPYHQAVTDFHEQAQPVLDEVMQRPEPVTPIPVDHVGPLQTQELPSQFGAVFAVLVGTNPEQILGADRARRRAIIISTDNPFLVSVTRSINGTRTAALWPANVPLILKHRAAVTVATPTGSANISVITENWAQ